MGIILCDGHSVRLMLLMGYQNFYCLGSLSHANTLYHGCDHGQSKVTLDF